jgi:hypothetical protein
MRRRWLIEKLPTQAQQQGLYGAPSQSPFKMKVPNSKTRKAIQELELGKGKHLTSVDALMDDLHADD